MSPAQQRRCRTCGDRKPVGHFALMEGGGRSFTCRGCTASVPAPTGDGGPSGIGHLSRPVEVTLTPTCAVCGALTDAEVTVALPPELQQEWVIADRLVTALTHRCPGPTAVHLARTTRSMP